MKLWEDKDGNTFFKFPKTEKKSAIGILKALYKLWKLPFLKEYVDDHEEKPPPLKIAFVSHHHLCMNCCRMLDDRVDSYVHHTGKNADKEDEDEWCHQVCAPLKEEFRGQ